MGMFSRIYTALRVVVFPFRRFDSQEGGGGLKKEGEGGRGKGEGGRFPGKIPKKVGGNSGGLWKDNAGGFGAPPGRRFPPTSFPVSLAGAIDTFAHQS